MLRNVLASLACAALVGLATPGAALPAQQPVAGGEYEVLTRGPVHEAFAEVVSFEAVAGPVIAPAPPAAVEEIPPDQRPADASAIWIPGYWAWDDENSRFLWVSGVWRVPPPETSWVPGYWQNADGGWRWVAGFWMTEAGATTDAEPVAYLPQPPAALELGPSSPAPAATYEWSPGNWTWVDYRYVWRPGFWFEPRADWVWVPARYSWTPCGWVFVDHHWDYVLARRGLLFAPVWWPRPPAVYRWTPSVVVYSDFLVDNLFCRPRWSHYYFGDWYAPGYWSSGIYPTFSFHLNFGYDPIFAHRRWSHRHDDRDWDRHVHERFEHLRDDPRERPPHDFREASDWVSSGRDRRTPAATLRDFAGRRPVGQQDAAPVLAPLTQDARATVAREAGQRSLARETRAQLERREAVDAVRTPDPRQRAPRTLSLPRTMPERTSEAARTAPTRAPEMPRTAPSRTAEAPRTAPTRMPETQRTAPTRMPEAPRTAPTRTPEIQRSAPTRTPEAPRSVPPARIPEAPRTAPTRAPQAPRTAPTRIPESPRPAPAPQRTSPVTPRVAPTPQSRPAPRIAPTPQRAAPSRPVAPQRTAPNPRPIPGRSGREGAGLPGDRSD